MKSFVILLGVLTGSAMVGCSTAPMTEARRDRLEDRAATALDRFKQEDSSADSVLHNSAAYAVFPTAGKGGAVVGGSYGHGVLYQNGQIVGYCDLTQASVGAQLGGQEFSELIVFKTQDAVDRFKRNDIAFTGNASAIVAKSGAAASAKYDNGVAVFTRSDAGLMAEAALAGQRFTYRTTEAVANDPKMNRDDRMTQDSTVRTQDRSIRTDEQRTSNPDSRANSNTNQADPNPNTDVNGADKTTGRRAPDNSARTE